LADALDRSIPSDNREDEWRRVICGSRPRRGIRTGSGDLGQAIKITFKAQFIGRD
jgi:hypothetical protein